MVAGDELALGLGQVVGQPVRLGQAGDEEHDHAERLRDAVPQTLLRVDDLAQVEAAGLEHDAHQREAHEHFVADHLRRRAHAADQRVLAVRRPAGEHHAVGAHRRHREEDQQADREVGDADAGRDRDDQEPEQPGHHDHRRSEHEEEAVRERRHPVLLPDQLDGVGDRLQQSERSDAVRSVALLDQREQPPLDPHQEAGEREHADQHAEHVEERADRLAHGFLTSPVAGSAR